MTREFICRDCGAHVDAFGEPDAFKPANDQDLCAECLWLRSIEDPVEREKLREFLRRRD
jgi:hypothetical protein